MKKTLNQYNPIPVLSPVTGWKQVPIRTSWFNDPLVPIGLFTDYSKDFFVDPVYSGLMSSSPYKLNEMNGCLVGAYLCKSIVKKLVIASKTLKPRHMFLVWDAYRPLSVQKALFDYFVQKLISERGGTTSDYLIEAQKFVSLPSDDKTKPSPHSTGAVVDLTIIEFTETGWAELQVLNSKLFDCKNEKERFEIEMKRFQLMRTESTPLPMGTMFDEVSPATNLYFYEDKTKEEIDIVCRFNRRYLTSRLWNVGFVAYEEEWWHFSHGDQFWAKKFDKTAKFTSAKWNSKCIAHEKMMQQVMLGLIRMNDGWSGSKLQARHLLYDFVKDVVQKTGDVRKTNHPKAISI